MELGDLEVEILHLLGELGEARPQEIHRRLQPTHPVAYTTVTNTLYRLVRKKLVQVRRTSPKRAHYSVVDNPRVQARAVKTLLSRLVRALGSDAVSRLVAEETSRPKRRRPKRQERS